jgi:hypothetical protein
MPQESADMIGHHCFLDIKVGQTISLVTQAPIVEIAVEREERRPVQLVQESNYLDIFHALAAKISANLPEGDVPAPQQNSLALRDVFIENVHAGRDSWA